MLKMKGFQSPKILICKMSSIGDVVMATPVARELKEAIPNAYITWIISNKCLDISAENPWIDEFLVWQSTLGNRTNILRELRLLPKVINVLFEIYRRRFDIVIDLQGLLRSALCVLSSGSKVRIGFADAREGSRFTYNIICPVENRGPQKYLDALKPLGIKSHNTQTYVPISASNRECANSLLEDLLGRCKQKTIIAFCPVSTWPHKTWPITHWATLARLIADKCHIIALGAPSDSCYIERISHEAGVPILNLAGKTTLGQAAAILDIIDLVVGLDSGLLHIALALGKPTVGIFGPTRWQYLTTFPNFIPLAAKLPCAPCCKKNPKCVDYKCIKAVLPEEVAAVVNTILSRARSSDEFNRIVVKT